MRFELLRQPKPGKAHPSSSNRSNESTIIDDLAALKAVVEALGTQLVRDPWLLLPWLCMLL